MPHSSTGILFDTSILIAGERRRESVEEILLPFRKKYGKIAVGLSTISVVELTHGIYRARNAEDSFRRRTFVNKALRDLLVYPVSLEIAQQAGQIEGEQAAKGIVIPFEDLVIGATALHFGFDVATHNAKHFQLIPNLRIVTP